MLNTLGGNAADTTAAVEAAAQAAVNPTDLEEFCNVCGADKGVARTFLARYGNNADAMSACYSDDVIFSDPAFGELRGRDVGDMWRMLTTRAKDFSLTFDHVPVICVSIWGQPFGCT